MSPSTTGMAASSTLVRSCSTIGADSSMPATGTPRSASGTATRPVPIASSSARPPPASAASLSTVGPSTSGANMPVPGVSYRRAASPSQISMGPTLPALPRRRPPGLRCPVAIDPGATLTPHFRDFLPGWVGRQPWYEGPAPPVRLTLVGAYRLADRDGEVGLETHLIGDGTAVYQVPMSYRGAPLPGAALIATATHSVLGDRWI